MTFLDVMRTIEVETKDASIDNGPHFLMEIIKRVRKIVNEQIRTEESVLKAHKKSDKDSIKQYDKEHMTAGESVSICRVPHGMSIEEANKILAKIHEQYPPTDHAKAGGKKNKNAS